MAGNHRSSRAVLFIHRCRNSYQTHPSTRSVSSASQYSPSTFNQPLRSPLTPTPDVAHRYRTPSNLNSEPTSSPDQPVKLPSLARQIAPPRNIPPPQVPPPRSQNNFTSWFRKLLGLRIPDLPRGQFPFHVHHNPYRAQKQWPPDFTKLPKQQQFHFEKTYRRRALLKWDRPNWKRWVKLVQNTLLVSITVYFLLIADPSDFGAGNPAWNIQAWFYGHMKDWTILPEGIRANAARTEDTMRTRIEIRHKVNEKLPLTEEEAQIIKAIQS